MTTDNSKDGLEVVPPTEILARARRIVDAFLLKSDIYPWGDTTVSLHRDQRVYHREAPVCMSAGPICCESDGTAPRLHLCAEGLDDITDLALQGGIERELMLWVLRQGNATRSPSFERQILPLMPVTGLAENHMREIVHWLQNGLKRYLADRRLTDAGGGAPQVHFLFFVLGVENQDGQAYYRTLRDHGWTHALYLCRKLSELMPVTCLSGADVAFARDLESRWWQTHAYLQAPARELLKSLVSVPGNLAGEPYDRQVVEMFTLVRDRLLQPAGTPRREKPNPTIH